MKTSCWVFLGIEETVDQMAIRRAYARLLRQHNPEDDAEAFKALRAAYEDALLQARYLVAKGDAEQQENPASEVAAEAEKMSNPAANTANDDIAVMQDTMQQIEAIKQRVAAIYADFQCRIDDGVWRDVLSTSVLDRLEIKQPVSLWLFGFLGHCAFLPDSVKQCLLETFDWEHNLLLLRRHYSSQQVEDVLEWLNDEDVWHIPVRGLRFPSGITGEDVDRYFHDREQLVRIVYQHDNAAFDRQLAQMLSRQICDPELLCWAIAHYHRLGDFSPARECCRQLIAMVPEQIDGYLRLAQIELDDRQYLRAADAFNQVLEMQSDHAVALKGLAGCFLAQGMLFEARELYRYLCTLVPYDVEAQIQVLKINAQTIAGGFATIKPKRYSMEYCEEVAECYLQNGAYTLCIDFIQHLMARAEYNAKPLPRLIRGSIFEVIYRSFFVKHGDFNERTLSSTLYMTLGDVHYQLDQYEDARQAYTWALEEAQRQGENGYGASVCLARVLLKLKIYQDVIPLLEKAQGYHRNDSEICFMLSEAFRFTDEYDKSLEYVNQAIALDASHWVYFSVRSIILHYIFERYEEALSDLNFIVRCKPSFSSVWYRRGICLSRLGRHREAIESLEEAIDWNIKDPDAALELLKSACELGLYDKAQRGVKLYQEYGGDMDEIGEWLMKLEQIAPGRQGVDNA
ncbi:tetratricopeptide repeat protein [Pectobacterium punjabense]|uniref:J domain-containing protein n=1 Tax=Pectobacterium punjabense TaxID=2108399 RepID=UPI0031200C8B